MKKLYEIEAKDAYDCTVADLKDLELAEIRWNGKPRMSRRVMSVHDGASGLLIRFEDDMTWNMVVSPTTPCRRIKETER